MDDQTILFLGPEENLTILKGIFSSKKSSPKEIAKITGKKKGTVNNSIHDLRILRLIDDEIETSNEAKNIVYNRDTKKILKEIFMSIHGYEEAINEVKSEEKLSSLIVGRIFCFHTNARATKESSIKQIGRLYLRWLKFLDIVENNKRGNKNGF